MLLMVVELLSCFYSIISCSLVNHVTIISFALLSMPTFASFQELELTNNKPIISNESIIPAAEAEKFPSLTGLKCLNDEIVDIPDFFTRNNREFVLAFHITLKHISILSCNN